jgi:succinate dehydrogenase / fumarate reductase cytochrome b subunit
MSRKGASFFNEHVVGGVDNLLNYKLMLEIVLGAMILFHGIYGIVIWWQGKSNVSRYRYGANWRYLFQRITAISTFVFILWHVHTTRVAAGVNQAIAENLFGRMQDIFSDPINVVFYLVGITGAAFHFSNGLWLFGITWGVSTHPRAQRVSNWVCMGIFVLITSLGFHALWGFNQRFF